MLLPPIKLKKWIDENREFLKPPVCNKVVYEDTEFIIMIVGGPNSRKDYHVDEGEEFFYQLEGDMVLRIMEDNKPKDIRISEGEIFVHVSNANIVCTKRLGVFLQMLGQLIPIVYFRLIGVDRSGALRK